MTSSSFHWRKDDASGIVRDEGAPTRLPRETTVTYCLHCAWELRAEDGYTDHERSKRAVDHHVATGHTVDSIAASD